MKHLSKLIETYLMPLSQKLSSNKYLVALRDGLMLSMPLLIVGSLAIVIGDFPVPAFHEFMTSIVGDVWNTWCWDMVNPATMGLVALFAVVGVSHSLASEEEVEAASGSGNLYQCLFSSAPADGWRRICYIQF